MNFEQLLLKYYDYFDEEFSESHRIFDGIGNVMVSSPHSVTQIRNGKLKFAEPQAGVLAMILHKELNCHIICKTKNCNDDANYDGVSPYRDDLIDYITQHKINFLIDLHQLSPEREVQINLGTGKYNNIDKEHLSIFTEEFALQGINNIQIDYPFDASAKNTISTAISKSCNMQCLQIEINTSLLISPTFNCSKFKEVYLAIKNSILRLQALKENL